MNKLSKKCCLFRLRLRIFKLLLKRNTPCKFSIDVLTYIKFPSKDKSWNLFNRVHFIYINLILLYWNFYSYPFNLQKTFFEKKLFIMIHISMLKISVCCWRKKDNLDTSLAFHWFSSFIALSSLIYLLVFVLLLINVIDTLILAIISICSLLLVSVLRYNVLSKYFY